VLAAVCKCIGAWDLYYKANITKLEILMHLLYLAIVLKYIMRLIIPTLLTLILSSCWRDKPITSYKKTFLLDLSPIGNELLEYDSSYRKSPYVIYYIGPSYDTIQIDKPISAEEDSGNNYTNTPFSQFGNGNNHLRIFVDTAISTTHSTYRTLIENNSKETEIEYLYKAYPVFIYNRSDSLIYISNYNFLTHLVRQAKNIDGQWQDIEKPSKIYCGINSRQIVTESHQMIVAKLLRYKGDYFTECRLKLGKNLYSNTFYDYIDKRQLTDTLDPYW
jgi:hypothetical protein